jgi:hypothetical protein
MRARCDAENWRLVSLGMVAFSRGEAKQIRKGLDRFERTEMHSAQESRFQRAGKP